MELWQLTHDDAFVADPYDGNGSLHTWGVAVDATLVDENGREVAMPTKYDEFYARGEDALPRRRSHRKGAPRISFRKRCGAEGFTECRPSGGISLPTIGKKYAPMREAKLLER